MVLDIDGVLTDGRVGYRDTDDEIKFFDVKDGHGVKLLMRAGFAVGFLSGRASRANQRRARELGVQFVYEGEKNKREAFDRLLKEQQLTPEQCLCAGDDLVDIPVLKKAGVAVAVKDAVSDVHEVADWSTNARGGQGAVREIAEWLLKQQGKWESAIERYVS